MCSSRTSLPSIMSPNLTENSIEPCGHAFCISCIRYRMRKTGHTICILCSKPASKIVISSAPMEAPRTKSSKLDNEAECSAQIPIEIRLPSLEKLASLPLVRGRRVAGSLLEYFGYRYDETQCRFVIAQILKDLNYPKEPFPSYVQEALNKIMYDVICWGSDDMVDLLLSLGVDINFKHDGFKTTLLERSTQGAWTAEFIQKKRRKEDIDWRTEWKWREYAAKRLIDAGCDWHSLEREDCPASQVLDSAWPNSPEVLKTFNSFMREGIVEYAREKEQEKGTETIEVYETS